MREGDEGEQSERQMERTGETGHLQLDIWVDTISGEGPGHMCYVCVLKEWGRGKTDHKHGHQVHSLQWGRKEEGQGEGGMEMKFKKKKKKEPKKLHPPVSLWNPASAQRKKKKNKNPASLSTSAGAAG